MIEVARTLGASRFMLVRHVALPLARPALAVGLSLVLLEALNDIGASEYLGVQTLTLSIFTTWINRSSLPGAAQIACVMLLIVIALMALERHGRRHRRFDSAAPAAHRAAHPAYGQRAISGFHRLRAPVLLGFFVPAGLSRAGDPARIIDRLRSRRCSVTPSPPSGWRRSRPPFAIGSDLPPRSPHAWRAKARELLPYDSGAWLCHSRHRAGARPALAAGRNRRADECRVRACSRPASVSCSPDRAPHCDRLCDPLSRDRYRLRASRARPRLRLRWTMSPARSAPTPPALRAHPAAADAARARRRSLARVCRLPERIAGDASVTSAQCRDTVDLYLSICHPRISRKARSRHC